MHFLAYEPPGSTAKVLRNQSPHNSFAHIQTKIIRLFRNLDYRIINVDS